MIRCKTNAIQVQLLVVGSVAALGSAVLFCFDPSRYHFYPVCVFHQVTGLLCPGCGSLRAFHQLLHGHLVNAFRFNPVSVMCLPLLLWIPGFLIMEGAKHRSSFVFARPIWLVLFLLVVLVFSIWRNLPGTYFCL